LPAAAIQAKTAATMRVLALLPLLAITAGCWQPRYFAPREHLDGNGPQGEPAALYPVPSSDVAATAEVRVWSSGATARFADDDDRELVELHVGFELENNSDAPLRLDPASIVCEGLMLDGLLLPPLTPVRVVGEGTAAPRSTIRVDAVFEPPTTTPRDIDAFAATFAVKRGEETVMSQVTPFAPWDPYPYYRDYYYPWGFGVGWGFGCHYHHHHHGHCW
jgi:hypothetical protein